MKKNLGGHYGNNTMRHFSLMSFPPNLGGKNLCARERKFSSKFFTLPSFPLLPKSGKSTFSFLCFPSLLKSTQLNTVQGLKVYFSKKSHTCLPQVNPIAVSLFLSLSSKTQSLCYPHSIENRISKISTKTNWWICNFEWFKTENFDNDDVAD